MCYNEYVIKRGTLNKRKNEVIKMTNEGIKMAQAMEYERIVRTHEKRAKSAIIKEKVAEYVAQGIDKTIAQVMAKTFYEYGI